MAPLHHRPTSICGKQRRKGGEGGGWGWGGQSGNFPSIQKKQQVEAAEGEVLRGWSSTCGHLAEDLEGLGVLRLDDVDAAGGPAPQEELVTVGRHLCTEETNKKKIHF